ncbi:hypothetical protein B9G69_006770 [Bdellovibrio sp. SKB1291214]|uniref:hypothetical protein n=1 Tax=Bdellovibrio sp. SKB1291214 TaxID=1732569 RepID=UPI00224075B9|nr:hypothetical protein [Bdellovibrio sp. SKB1291214]UYL10280.1 hypothetical protein B9G69_006770 [Bdellovibrio sp. SKB1291214]
MIVDTTVVDRLLKFVSVETMQRFIRAEMSQAPNPESPQFKVWIKESRSQTRLSQRDFASKLNEITGLKIHGSDIGNLETGARPEAYAIERLISIRSTIITALPHILSELRESSL